MRIRDLRPWLSGYLMDRFRKLPSLSGADHHKPTDLIVCIADHFEPRLGQVSLKVERERMNAWETGYPELASRHHDSDGVHPQHTWFFPIDEYWDEHLVALARLQRQGYGEVEVHLHHGHDTSQSLREQLLRAKKFYAQHGLLSYERSQGIEGGIRYGFIHGNWALDNSRGDPRWCGVDNELEVLQETGCYADFTFPSLIYPTQPRMVNAIYYAHDHPTQPKSYDTGQSAEVGSVGRGELLLVTGPVGINWRRRRKGLVPTVENADLSWHHPPTSTRIQLWIRAQIHVLGNTQWLFIKLHTHGAEDGTREMFTVKGSSMDRMFEELETHYADGERYRLHYVTAREMYNMVKAAEAGMTGNPNAYRNFQLVPQLP